MVATGSRNLVASVFEGQVSQAPDSVAISSESHYVTYEKLDRHASFCAHHLLGVGVKAETPIAIACERTCELIVATLAVLKAGCVCVPIDPKHPKKRNLKILQNTGPAVILTQTDRMFGQCDEPWTALGVRCFNLEDIPNEVPSNVEPIPVYDSPDRLAYVIHTSGTTGAPKGVMLSHAALCNRISWSQQAYPLSPSDRVLLMAPVGFDFSIWEIFAPLSAGAQIVLPSTAADRDPGVIVATIVSHAVTVIHCVPSLLEAMMDETKYVDCTSLRIVLCGGETLSATTKERALSLLKYDLYNQYGPTETAIDVTAVSFHGGYPIHDVPIGKPIANTWIRLLDEDMNLAGIGIPGELCVGGVGLARGYLNRADLPTAEDRFVPDPFSDSGGQRLYRTGDLARWRADGNLDFLGRIDDQIKIRGFRIEPAEIERVLCEHDQIAEAVVIARQDETTDKRLVAYFTVLGGQAVDAQELRGYLTARLPDYMLPVAYVDGCIA